MGQFIFDLMAEGDYENIVFCQEKTLGLKAIIAIHDTTLGPAAGGIRMWPYASEEEAVTDVVRLARAMTYKNAAAGLAYGGGKIVISGVDSLNPGGFNRQRALDKVAQIYRTIEQVIAIARAQHSSTDRAAAFLVEQRIAMVRQEKSLTVDF